MKLTDLFWFEVEVLQHVPKALPLLQHGGQLWWGLEMRHAPKVHQSEQEAERRGYRRQSRCHFYGSFFTKMCRQKVGQKKVFLPPHSHSLNILHVFALFEVLLPTSQQPQCRFCPAVGLLKFPFAKWKVRKKVFLGQKNAKISWSIKLEFSPSKHICTQFAPVNFQQFSSKTNDSQQNGSCREW